MSSSKEAAKALIVVLMVIGLFTSGQVLSSEASSEDHATSSSGFSVLPEAMDQERNGLANLFYELQILRQELQYLRGSVEEQSHNLERLIKAQQDQYVDLDRRILSLMNGGEDLVLEEPINGDHARKNDGETTLSVRGLGTEREDYAQAFKLAQDEEIDSAIISFDRLISDYPNGELTPNAFYWLGQLYFIRMEYEKSRQSFAQLLNLYPSHQKVADTLYKLGVTYHRLGDVERCIQLFARVQQEFPRSPAAGLAKAYALEME
ncbi:MAG: tol-pal system protein YbgF [Gammaproteobacteria bacterium]|nr:tol-pal system protein YbgF [Gammaproteobacteria bacterium]MCH2669071.1 tol-pal system protein YbgF [Gammaproteobacteria bacterium]